MTSKFHLTPAGVKPCAAVKRPCKYGEAAHHDTRQEAQAAFEASLSAKLSSVPSMGKRGSAQELHDDLRERRAKSLSYRLLEAGLRQRKVEALVQRLEEDGQTTDRRYARVVGGELLFTEERRGQQEVIIQAVLSRYSAVPREGKVVVAGGLGGAGKTTVLSEYAGIDLKHYAMLNPDDVKEEMAKRGMIPQVKGLTPMEASPLVHEEASHITKVLTARLAAQRRNIILDVTMAGKHSLSKKLSDLRAAGYTSVEAIFVDIAPATSLERSAGRYRDGLNNYLRGEGHGGRILPERIVTDQAPVNKRYRSRNAEVLVEATREEFFTSKPRVFDNNRTGQAPREMAFEDFHHHSGDLVTW